MASHAPRLILGILASTTVVLTVGGTVGVWPVGAPAFDLDSRAQGVASKPSTPLLRQVDARDATRDEPGDRRRDGGSHQVESGSVRSESGQPTSDEPESSRSESALSQTFGSAGGAADAEAEAMAAPALPPRSGSGRRVVFDLGDQRVWLVGERETVRRSYLVSGSQHDNLSPGRYAVYSRSRHATSFTYDETMDYMVRFAQGERAAIGFHDIPVDVRGQRVQTRRQLGQPLSAGCVRQARPDAIALWRFADVGTRVVVTR